MRHSGAPREWTGTCTDAAAALVFVSQMPPAASLVGLAPYDDEWFFV